MLIGEYIHTLDEKSRVSLPMKFRKEMGKTVIVTRGLDHCLFVFTMKEWQKTSERLSENSLLQADNRGFSRFLLGGATEVDVDGSGRILIPDFLKEYASLTSQKVALIGVQSRVEIWNDTLWNEYKTVVDKQADALAEKLGQVGIL